MGAHSSHTKQTSPLIANHEMSIPQKIDFETTKMFFSIARIGATTNIFFGLFVIWMLYKHTSLPLLLGWYAALCAVNIANIIWITLHQNIGNNPDELKSWRKIFFFIVVVTCFMWSCVAFLFPLNSVIYQFYTIAFLLIVLFGFCFSTIADLPVSMLSITGLLVPTIIAHLYRGIYIKLNTGDDPSLNFGISFGLLILGAFLVVISFIGAKLVRKYFTLTFENIELNKKLGNINKFLEIRVKERTVELEQSLKQVTYQATHDLLTNLPNQHLLLKYLEKSIEAANTTKIPFYIACFSINEMERINDGLGHHVGDLVIKTIAERFKKIVSDYTEKHPHLHYTVALTRKDIFVVIIESSLSENNITQKTEMLFPILDVPIYVNKQIIKTTASIGISQYPQDGKDTFSLLKNADAAMLQAKKRGGNSLQFYKTELNINIAKQLQIESHLHNALKNGEFTLQYQPVIELKTEKICGAEALVRWNNPDLGTISPDSFIPLAEANGVIIPLGEWVLRTACLQVKKWHDQGFTTLRMAVNLSSKQLQQKNIIETVAAILKETGVNPDLIELELTEREAFQEEVIPMLIKFKELGLRLVIDDYGTGYSNLSNLSLPIDKLKIDKSFIKDVEKNQDSQAIVANTIDLAKRIHVTIVAEGVETKEQLAFLQKHGCDMIQGYYFSRPLNIDSFSALLMNKTPLVV